MEKMPTLNYILLPLGGIEMGRNYVYTSDRTTYFKAQITSRQTVTENLPMRADGRGKITGLTVYSADNLTWQLEFLTPNLDAVVGVVKLEATEADTWKDSSDVKWNVYVKHGLNIPIVNTHAEKYLPVRLRNLSTKAKAATSGNTGAFELHLVVEK